jgi:SAM-dependent methyltransferase
MDLAPLYQFPHFYDVVFGRDVDPEVQFIRDLFARHAGRPLATLVELACGPGYHARSFAQSGAAVVGLDLSPEMIGFARSEAAARNIDVNWQVANILDFSLEHPVDCAICMFDGLDSLLRNTDLVQHFQAVGRNLLPGGLYVLQLTHPRQASYDRYGPFHYAAARDDLSVEINWGVNSPQYDLVTGIAAVEVETIITISEQRTVSRATHFERILYPQELALMAQLAGSHDCLEWYGDFDFQVHLDASARSQCMLGVFQKKP